MKRSEVISLVAAIRDRFPKAAKEFPADSAKAYCEDLQDLPYIAAMSAVRRLSATVDWFPSIAEIRRATHQITDPVPDADEAWKEVLKWGNDTGWGRTVYTDHNGEKIPGPPCTLHPAALAALEGLGGLKEIGRSSNQAVDRAHFLKMYAAAEKRYIDRAVSLPLVEATMKQLKGKYARTQEDDDLDIRH